MSTALLVLMIFCGAGAVSAVTYIVCLLVFEKKAFKRRKDKKEEYLLDEEVLTIDLKKR